MARFYVGQRVRLVRTRAPFLGKEGTITGAGECEYSTVAGGRQFGFVYDITIDGIGAYLPGTTARLVAAPDQLEPLTPPKQQEVVEWSECEFTRDGKWRVSEAA